MVQVAPVSQQIWDMKYRLEDAGRARLLDKTIADTWRRVARELARAEADPAVWEERFFPAMEDFKFLPAGRILSGAGSGRRVTLFNCFVMGDIPDDMSGIFEHLKQAALTMQQGGGIGYDFSTLRPKGAPVKGVGADASGPLSFMDVWDAMCRTIMSAGSRRGAMMAVMRCDHPDIEAFIEAKRERGPAAHVQPVGAGDRRLHAGGQGGRAVGADLRAGSRTRACGRASCGTRSCAPPTPTPSRGWCSSTASTAATICGIAKRSTAPTRAASSRCPPTGRACSARSTWRASSRSRSSRSAGIDEARLAALTAVAVRMMDNVIDVSRYPLPQHEAEARGQAADRPRRHRPCRRADPVRRPLRRRARRCG